MDASEVIDLGRQAISLVLIVGAPVLISVLIVSLIVSILQAATQVQDPTLSFVPKILAVLLAVAIAGPWMLERLTAFAVEMFAPMP